ncbi:MAG: hypothetical protein LBM25_05700 [Bacteroidales bacterium]|jgi:hypothetical protein|nr:hypothetical protein [Bacteroidales bacterium]
MKKLFLVAILSLSLAIGVNAQGYNWGVGLRLGADYGLTVKKQLGSGALDFMGNFHNHGFQVSGLYEWQNNVINKDFTLYYGVGPSLGFWDNDKGDGAFGLGIDGIIGLEYKIPNVPIALSLDWKPSFELMPQTGFYWKGFALSVKYVF